MSRCVQFRQESRTLLDHTDWFQR